jgi:hypothetical protein
VAKKVIIKSEVEVLQDYLNDEKEKLRDLEKFQRDLAVGISNIREEIKRTEELIEKKSSAKPN